MVAYLLYRFGYFLANALPLRAGYALATFISLLKYYLSPRDRNAVINNLKFILSPNEQKHIRACAREVFVNFGKYLIEFFRIKLLLKGDLGTKVSVAGIVHVDQALSRGKGVIVLAAHLGNWEMGGVFMSLLGYPMIAVALPHKHRKVNAFFNRQRERIGVTVVPSLGIAIRRIYDALKENKMVALVGDRDFTNGGVKLPFLGASKIIPRGPAYLALRTGAAIVPGFAIRQPDDTIVVEFSEPAEKMASEEEIVVWYKKIIEDKIRQHPTQWLMFREFWNE